MSDKQTEREHLGAVVGSYGKLQEAQAALERHDYGLAREAVTDALRSLARYELSLD